jgi:hypothetical protein
MAHLKRYKKLFRKVKYLEAQNIQEILIGENKWEFLTDFPESPKRSLQSQHLYSPLLL